MKIAIVSLFPELVQQVGQWGVTGRAVARGLLQLSLHQPRYFALDRHRTVDDRSYGGGPGMVMQAQVLADALAAARASAGEQALVVHLSPQGQPLTQALAAQLAQQPGLVLLCSRYEGVDQRLLEQAVDFEISIGDYVLSGGELPAMVLVDAMARLLPGALGDAQSAEQDSFTHGLLDHPHYTRPESWRNQAVPAVLLSGDHAAIARWRLQQALGRTWLLRQDLLDGMDLEENTRRFLCDMIAQYLDEAAQPDPDE